MHSLPYFKTHFISKAHTVVVKRFVKKTYAFKQNSISKGLEGGTRSYHYEIGGGAFAMFSKKTNAGCSRSSHCEMVALLQLHFSSPVSKLKIKSPDKKQSVF